jgi:hypothetical protein
MRVAHSHGTQAIPHRLGREEAASLGREISVTPLDRPLG